MDNRDWLINDREATKFFSFDNEELAGKFIQKVRRMGKSEQHLLKFRRMKNGDIRVRIPLEKPGMYTEEEVRLLNLINKLGG